MRSETLHNFSVPSSVESIDGAVAEIVTFAEMAGFQEAALFGIDMAARESVANAMKHGNKLDPAKPVEVSLIANESEISIEVRDRGDGFSPEALPDPTDPENLLKATGRGILFMKNFMDEVSWNRHPEGGTLACMRKAR